MLNKQLIHIKFSTNNKKKTRRIEHRNKQKRLRNITWSLIISISGHSTISESALKTFIVKELWQLFDLVGKMKKKTTKIDTTYHVEVNK